LKYRDIPARLIWANLMEFGVEMEKNEILGGLVTILFVGKLDRRLKRSWWFKKIE